MSAVLVVDDSGIIRSAIRRILESLGHVVIEAPDGAQALEVCNSGQPIAAVLCDIDMPVMDGLTFLAQYQALYRERAVPVIMCTTHNTFDRIKGAMSLGASEYIMKPFDAEIMSEKLAACGVR
ncbi:MAG: response regulator [Phycisphaerae bacterium]|nr:response regulator [Gemmatimonadaceae bacterium]